jgi:hypothetical protein
MEAEILREHGYESEQEGVAPYAGAGWGMIHDCSKYRAVQAVSQVEHRRWRQFEALKARLDSGLEQRTKEGELLLPNSITKMVAASN